MFGRVHGIPMGACGRNIDTHRAYMVSPNIFSIQYRIGNMLLSDYNTQNAR
jgi:hypothetical protein